MMDGEAAILARIDEFGKGLNRRLDKVDEWQAGHDRRHEQAEEKRIIMVTDLAMIKQRLDLTPSPTDQAGRIGALEGRIKNMVLVLTGLATLVAGLFIEFLAGALRTFTGPPKPVVP